MNTEEWKKLKDALFEIVERGQRNPDETEAALQAAKLLIKIAS